MKEVGFLPKKVSGEVKQSSIKLLQSHLLLCEEGSKEHDNCDHCSEEIVDIGEKEKTLAVNYQTCYSKDSVVTLEVNYKSDTEGTESSIDTANEDTKKCYKELDQLEVKKIVQEGCKSSAIVYSINPIPCGPLIQLISCGGGGFNTP